MGQIQGGYRGPDIVSDGLVLYLDAASPNSYRSDYGTTWRDVSGGGNNGTLTNEPTFDSQNGGSILFDGINDFVSISGTRSLTTFTMLCWIRRNGFQDSYVGIMFNRSTNANTVGMNIGPDRLVKLGYHYKNQESTYNFNSNLIIPDLTWCMVAYVQESTQAILYVNTSSATNAVGQAGADLNVLNLCRDSDFASRVFKGNVAISMLYNRNLSAAEILQNYNAQKSRFGV